MGTRCIRAGVLISPSGFASRSCLFTKEFIDILESLNGLNCIQKSRDARKNDAMFTLPCQQPHSIGSIEAQHICRSFLSHSSVGALRLICAPSGNPARCGVSW
jgi:hypothetical protein